MNLLILVQACMKPPYNGMLDAQRRTWDSIEVPGVRTVFYYGGMITHFTDPVLMCASSDDMDQAHWKCKIAFDFVWDWPWEMIFRTNASSYVDKAMTLAKAKTLPRQRCYCGLDGGNFASGAGMFLSRDVVDVLRNSIDRTPTHAEDAEMGTILMRRGFEQTPGAVRHDFWWMGDMPLPDVYHYRCKPIDSDRTKDIQAFDTIHRMKLSKHAKPALAVQPVDEAMATPPSEASTT